MDKINEIENLIGKDYVREAISELKLLVVQDKILNDTLTINEGSFNQLSNEVMRGQLDNAEKNIQLVRVRSSLISLCGDVRRERPLWDTRTDEEKRDEQRLVISKMRFATINSGTFLMGSEKGLDNEKPCHEVKIEKKFQIGVTPITQKQWKVIMDSEPWKGLSKIKEGDNYPATYIDWNGANTFIKRINAIDAKNTYRFPTEAEWEYCCRAGSTTEFCFGDDERQLKIYGWYDENGEKAGLNYAQEVGLLESNFWGIYDMHGNIWEWVNDWYIDSYEPSKKYDFIDDRVLRGGGWDYSVFGARSSFRYHSKPSRTNHVIGFRVVKELL